MQTVKELQASELVDKIYLLGSAPGRNVSRIVNGSLSMGFTPQVR